MKYLKILALLASFNLLACGVDLLKENPDAEFAGELPDLEPGQACTKDLECPEGFTCIDDKLYPHGKCVANCKSDEDCGGPCSYCSQSSHICEPFPKGQKVVYCSGDFQECNGAGSCVCIGHHGGDRCYDCLLGWSGDNCDVCAFNFTGENCEECQPGYYGPSCQKCDCGSLYCREGRSGTGECFSCPSGYTGVNCDKEIKCVHGALDPQTGHCQAGSCEKKYTGNNCDECENSLMTGANCDQCKNSLMTGANCDECKNSLMTGANCDQCKNLLMTGANCDQCKNSLMTGANCDECKNSLMTGANCDECKNSLMTGANCDECKNSLMTGANCDECDTTKGYGTNCTAYGSVTDQAGNTYKTVIINGREWMAENYQRKTGTYYNPNNNSSNVATYGLLYTWATATSANFCPTGWRLPTKAEFDSLLTYVGSDSSTRSQNLRATTWSSGADKYGFGALPAGNCLSGSYHYFGSYAYFWSSTEDSSSYAYNLYVDSSNARMFSLKKTYGVSVRCVRD